VHWVDGVLRIDGPESVQQLRFIIENRDLTSDIDRAARRTAQLAFLAEELRKSA
jgi:hypothetical protein